MSVCVSVCECMLVSTYDLLYHSQVRAIYMQDSQIALAFVRCKVMIWRIKTNGEYTHEYTLECTHDYRIFKKRFYLVKENKWRIDS